MKKLPDTIIAQIIQDYQAGTPSKIIAEKVGLRGNSIARILRRLGIERNQQKRIDKATEQSILLQYLAGEANATNIARQLDVSSSTITRLLHRNNIEKHMIKKAVIEPITISEGKPANYGTDYFLHWGEMELNKTNVAKLSMEEQKQAAVVARDYFRLYGFPHPVLSNDELIKAFSHLKNADTESIRIDDVFRIENQAGLPIIKHFSPHFFEVKSGKKTSRPSMMEVFNSDDLLLKVIENRLEIGFHINGNMLRQGLATSKIAYKASIFNIMVAKAIYSKYAKPGDTIYDYSMGFGQRQLAALSLPFPVQYVGVDVWSKSVASNQAIFDFFSQAAGFNKGVELNCIGSENYCPEELKGKVSLAFSSPPYWNLEKYSDDPGQACIKSYDDFLHQYWKETVGNIEKMLSETGLFIININDKVDGFNIGKDMCQMIEEKGFRLKETMRMRLTKNLKFGNKAGVHKYEPIYVFSRDGQ